MKGSVKPKKMPMPPMGKGANKMPMQPSPADGQMGNAPAFKRGGLVKKSKKK